ncbi:aminoglycoside phosphotransferase family protein [Deinococcus pimensis]|uniref:aminoglycoside phosphotransferase family protein n=1 Tax=Deinococcus pimensis TaxID=309888 RepID=UPI000485E7DA|nr:aminoglycoside phosphotransferase family protein [Deinococcus pimensis]
MHDALEELLALWDLRRDGDVLVTPAARLLPVTHGGRPAMLKLPHEEEEVRGSLALAWWDGRGGAPVLASAEDGALLMERSPEPARLTAMALGGRDDDATRVLCDVARGLHEPFPDVPASFTPLETWFRALGPAAGLHGGVLHASHEAASALLADARDVTTLHGDLHHGNVLPFGERGWLAIDPKALLGERGFDFANILCNPDAGLALAPGRLERQVNVISERAGLDRVRLLRWVLAYAGLSAAWTLGDGGDASLALGVAEIARRALSFPA